MLYGGSRSGKTFLHTRNVIWRALKAKNSRHAILRFRFNAVKSAIGMDTLPTVMRVCFPGVDYTLSKSDWFVTFPNGSEVWLGGLDDKERTEKILGTEYATIYLNECSQIPWRSVETALTRLAQKCTQEIDGDITPLKLRAFYDCNPPSKAHWAYKVFAQKVDPETGINLAAPMDYAWARLNPQDNAENIASDYLDTLKQLSGRMQRRFLLGEWADATPNALFPDEVVDRWRAVDKELPDMVRVVVGVDPSGSGDTDNADNDEIGIVVGGLGTDGNAYLLEDCTVKAGPATWARVAVSAYERHQGDVIACETNFGGEMVLSTIRTTGTRAPVKKLTASRGKVPRAEPFSSLYEQGKIRHAGMFPKLETELFAFSTNGYMGDGSPNRADAWVWVLSELFPGLVKREKPAGEKVVRQQYAVGAGGWMGA